VTSKCCKYLPVCQQQRGQGATDEGQQRAHDASMHQEVHPRQKHHIDRGTHHRLHCINDVLFKMGNIGSSWAKFGQVCKRTDASHEEVACVCVVSFVWSRHATYRVQCQLREHCPVALRVVLANTLFQEPVPEMAGGSCTGQGSSSLPVNEPSQAASADHELQMQMIGTAHHRSGLQKRTARCCGASQSPQRRNRPSLLLVQ
jgi:hypothetical protein